MEAREDERDRDEGAMWREFGLRQALANMPADSPGRVVVERLLATESSETATPPAASRDLPEQLERLVGLHERGHLSDTEFESAKRKLLS